MTEKVFGRISYHSSDQEEVKAGVVREEATGEADTDEDEAKPKRTFSWVYKQTFANKNDAENWINEEKIWSKYYKHEVDVGTKIFYRCNLVPYRGQQCAAAVYLLYDAESFDVLLYETDEKHDHDELLSNKRGINQPTKEAIDALNVFKLAPKAILKQLEKQAAAPNSAIKVPTHTQLYNYLSRKRGYLYHELLYEFKHFA